MKKYFLLLFTAFLALHTHAQNIKGPYIGVTTQFQNTYIINDEQYDDVNYKHTFTTKWAPFGVTLGYKFNENHNVQVELIRSKQGEVLDLIDQDGEKAGEKHIDLVYWNIPVLFKYTTPGKVRFTFQVGPQLSILQEGTEENRFSRTATYKREVNTFTIPQGNYLLASTESTAADMGQFNEYDLGLLAGLGLEVDVTKHMFLTANLRYHYNFVNIRKEEQINSPRDPDTFTLRQNMVVGAQLGVHFLFNTGDGRSNAQHQ